MLSSCFLHLNFMCYSSMIYMNYFIFSARFSAASWMNMSTSLAEDGKLAQDPNFKLNKHLKNLNTFKCSCCE